MPRLARFKIAAIEDLLQQLEFAPPQTRMRQMDAAERLIADLDPKQNYPQDFVVFRITGYRPDLGDEPVTFVGEALLPDLVNLVQVLSESLDLKPDHAGRQAVPLEQVATRLRVSGKTIQRYRKQGLVCHYVAFDDDSKRLACFQDALDRFAGGQKPRLDKAASFSRVEGEVEAAIIAAARQLREQQPVSLNEAAKRLAIEHGRAHETVRMMLRRHDRRSSQPIFVERGPLTDREVLLAHRAWQRGVDPADLARRFGKTRPTVHRAINRRRAELLSSVKLRFVGLPTFEMPEAQTVLLSAPAATSGLERDPATEDGMGLIAWAEAAPDPNSDVELALLAAFNLLKLRTSAAIAALDQTSGAAILDQIETDLRWIAMLQRKLVVMAFPAALGRIEQNLGRPLRTMSAQHIATYLELALRVTSKAIESIDPGRGQRLERVAGFAIEKALAKKSPPPVPPAVGGRAAVRHHAGSIPVGSILDLLSPWNAWLELRRDLRPHVTGLPDDQRSAITMRYGLAGRAPMTCAALAAAMRLKTVGAVRLLRRAQRGLRALARGETKSS